MSSLITNDNRVKKANSAYEDTDLSGVATDEGKNVYPQDDYCLFESFAYWIQKKFLPEVLTLCRNGKEYISITELNEFNFVLGLPKKVILEYQAALN